MNYSLNVFIITLLYVLGFAFIIFLIAFLILELLMREKEVDKYVKERNIKDLVKRFHKKLDMVSNQRTNEILECLKEMEELDSIYYVMVDNDYRVMSEEKFIKVKSEILDNIIKNKYDDIKHSSNKKEKYKALFDEIEVCQKRFPLYKNIYFEHKKNIQEKI